MTSESRSVPEPSPAVLKAITEQQHRVWRLYSMLHALNEAAEGVSGHNGTDISAALTAAMEYAQMIETGLDPETLRERVRDIESESEESAEVVS
jgi:division protein CdvB (Snf7/Vps24/ESCRT-III family)